jgi:hypothetical protein
VKCSGHLFRFDFSRPRFPRKKRRKMSDQPVCKKTNINEQSPRHSSVRCWMTQLFWDGTEGSVPAARRSGDLLRRDELLVLVQVHHNRRHGCVNPTPASPRTRRVSSPAFASSRTSRLRGFSRRREARVSRETPLRNDPRPAATRDDDRDTKPGGIAPPPPHDARARLPRPLLSPPPRMVPFFFARASPFVAALSRRKI